MQGTLARILWGLAHLLLLLLVLVYKTILWEPVGYPVFEAIGFDRYAWNASRFVGVSVIPMLYAAGWLRYFLRNRKKYRKVEGILYLTLVSAMLLTISTLNLTLPPLSDYFPFNLLVPIILIELYFSISLVCVVVAWPFLLFGKAENM